MEAHAHALAAAARWRRQRSRLHLARTAALHAIVEPAGAPCCTPSLVSPQGSCRPQLTVAAAPRVAIGPQRSWSRSRASTTGWNWARRC